MLYNEEIELDEDFEGVDDSEAEVVTEFDEIDENTDYDNNYTYVDIDFQQDTPQLIDTPTPVVDPVVEETELIPDPEFETVTETYEMIIQEYSQEYLQSLEDDGYTFYVIYEDGTEDEVDISEIEEPTTSIEFLDDEAYVLANSILEHFWDDDSGVHVTQDTKEAWAQLVEDNFPDLDATHPHHNIIVNSYGVLIRSALKNLVQLSRSALAFYDGLGNNSSNIISTFGRGGIQIGPTDQKHLIINNNGITVYNGDGTIAPLTASNIAAIEANIQTLIAADATITGRLTAAEGNITTLTSSKANVTDLTAATARITSLEADHVTVSDFQAEQANIDNLQTATADIATIRANSAKVANLTAQQLEADHATVGSLSTNYAHISNGVIDNAKIDQADVNNLSANYAHIANGVIDNAKISYADVNGLSANYAQVNMANVNNAWIQNGTVKDGAITNAMINSVSANKLTAGTIDASNITVTNLNADNITAGTLNGQRIGAGTLSLDKLEEDVYTETEVNNIVDGLNDRIDGAIETFTGTVIPTLNNTPASAWTTNDIKDTHVGDVYYVVNSQSDQNGYCYRFTKINNAYSWQLIKDSDVTAALARLSNAEDSIGTIEQFDQEISSWKTNTDAEITSIKANHTSLATRVTNAEGTLANKVDTSTFVSLSQTVDGHSSSITQLTTETTTLTQAVDTLNTKTSSDSGNVIQFDNSIGFKEITVHGKSEQASYTGKNLFDPSYILEASGWTVNNGIYTGGSNYLYVKYGANSGGYPVSGLSGTAQSYTMSLDYTPSDSTKYTYAQFKYDDGTIEHYAIALNVAGHYTGTTNPNKVLAGISFTYSSGQTISLSNIQLELGSTATSYEPYTGGKPSPNPDYPQPIVSVDDLTLHVCGKNLFDRNGEESGYLWTDGKKYDTSGWLVSSFIPVVAGITYTFAPNTTAGEAAKGCFYDINKTFIAGSAFNSGPITVTAPQGAVYARFSYRDTSTNVQLELGDTATDYEPYKGQSIDIPLGDHQIRSLPDGTEDTLTFSYIGPSIREGWGLYNAELVQNVTVETITDQLGWTKSTAYPGGYYCPGWAGSRSIASSPNHIQNRFITATNLSKYVAGTCYLDNSLNFRFDNEDVSTVDDFKAWLSNNPVDIQYPLVTPITHSLGVVELPLSEDLNLWATTSPATTIDATWWHEPGRVEKNEIDISLTASNLENSINSTTLPAPYTEVEWVESNGAQYVYLDWKPPIATWGFEADFIIRNAFSTSVGAWNPNTNANGYGNVFGTRNWSMTNDIQLGTYNSNGVIRWGQTGNDSAGLFKKDKTRQQVSLKGTTLTKADGTTVTITRSTEVDSKFYANMAVFCMHEGLRRGGTGNIVQPGSVRIYSLKFYDGDELKVDLVGAIRNRDGITGLYDKVKDHFYPAYGMTYGEAVGDLGTPDTILEAVAKSKINVHIDNRQISRMWRAEVPELNRLEDGQTISVTFSTNIGSTTPAAAGLVGWDETATTAYSNVFLKLVLADETETEWIPCFYAQGTRLTSHYGSGTPILLTYRENVLYGASTTNAGTSVMRAWYADPNYVDGNTQYTKYSNSVIAGLNGIKRYSLCMKDQNGKWTSIVNQANTVAATKTCYTGGLQLDTILYYNPANEIAAGNSSSDGLWESFGIIDWRYSFNVENNATNGLTYRTPLYLVGTLSNSDGLFYLDTTKWWTQVPNDPTKIYIWVSAGYTNYYQGILSVQNTVYAYDEDAGLIEINVSRYSKTTTKLNQTIDTVNEHTRKIGVLETTVENKADGSDVTTISNKLNTVSDTVDGHSQTITSVQTTVNGLGTRVTAAESNITQNATNINLKVSKDGVISSINQSAETVKIQASKVEIDGTAIFSNTAFRQAADSAYDAKGSAQTVQNNLDNLEIGGRNLFTWPLGGTKWKDEEHSLNTYQNRGSFTQFTGSLLFDPSETVGEQYTISFWAKSPNGTTALQIYNNNGTPKYFWFPAKTLTPALGNEWEFFSLTVTNAEYSGDNTPNTNETYWRRIEIYAPNATGVLVKQIKVEKGSKATDWTPAPEDVDSAISAAQATANAAAPKANAVKRTQRIWYRKSAAGAPATPGTASSNWVTKADDGDNAWTKMHVAISSSAKYIYTCEQYEMANGTVGYTSVLLDNTITVIDGGSIITSSVTADQIAAGSITTEKLDTDNLLIGTGNIENLDIDLSGIQERISSVSLDLYGGVTDDGDEVQSIYSIIEGVSDTITSNMEKADDNAVDRAIQSIQEDLTEYVTKETHRIDIKALDDNVQSSSSLLNTISTDLYGAEATEGSDKIDPIFVTSTVLDDRDEEIDVKIDNKARDTINEIDKSYASTKAEFNELKGYIAGYVDETTQIPMLVLGQRSGAVQAVLTNSVLDFIASTDDVPVASIGIENGNGLLKVTRANIGELNIGDNASGHWQWQQRQNGNLALKFISESE